ncbi:MAG TPA: UDP-N-acetylmuramate dehydrogenase [bacterium]
MKKAFRISPAAGFEIRRGEQLAGHTSLGIGGKADYFIRVHSRKGLRQVLAFVARYRLRAMVIGAGTNVLFSDRGFKGVVIKLCGSFSEIKMGGEQCVCGAGVYLRTLVKKARDTQRRGAEFLAGIPGTVGGAVKGNAGAWGHAIAGITENVTVMTRDGKVKVLEAEEIGFKYRSSRISDRHTIVSVTLRLGKGRRSVISGTIKKYLAQRNARQPSGRSAGSFFKNPPGNPAGKLIEECGLKGSRVGQAMVSLRHGNFIMNCGRATADDVLALVRKIQNAVRRNKGIKLQPEVRIVR